MTRAPIAIAYSIAIIAPSVVPKPLASKNFNAMIRTCQDTPATPTPLLPDAPTVPDTCVP